VFNFGTSYLGAKIGQNKTCIYTHKSNWKAFTMWNRWLGWQERNYRKIKIGQNKTMTKISRFTVLDTTSCDKVCQWLATGRWFSLTFCLLITSFGIFKHSLLDLICFPTFLSIPIAWPVNHSDNR
jgi:hypothetical protein